MSSSNSSLPVAISKNAGVQTQISPAAQNQSNLSVGAENYPHRRSGGSSSGGAGSVSRVSPAAARNNQPLRKQHKGQRRPRLADEDAAAESAVMHSTRNRKGQTSITHLMNFVLPPRPQSYSHSHQARNARRNPTWGLGSGYHAADKASVAHEQIFDQRTRYIHANYRFIVDPRGNYRAQALDADVHLDWTNVLQILASARSQDASCPICLSSPVAPRMAKCGHIFCLPCMLRYMHSTDDMNPFPEKKARWKKCPICWDSVYVSETRPVRWFVGQEGEPPFEGSDVILRLVSRQPGSTLALPRDGATTLNSDEDVPWYLAAEVMDYARVMKGGEDYMSAEYDREIETLYRQEREDELMFGEETQWTQKAVVSITELKERLKGLGNPPTISSVPTDRKARRGQQEFHDHSATSLGANSIQGVTPSPMLKEGSPKPISTTLSDTLGGGPSQGPCQSTSPFFFYEALQHFYLSPLDIRILKAAFGEFSHFPSTILPRVERVSTGHIVDDELRRRAKYLGHLPRGCEVAFLECDWTDTVSAEVLGGFSVEIERRRRRNHEKDVREEKERARAEKEEDDKRWATARRRRPAVPPDNFTEMEFEPLASSHEGFDHVSSSVDSGIASSSPPWPTSRTQAGSGFTSLASPSTSPVAARTVWGTPAVAPPSPVLAPIPQEQESAENDGWLQNWEDDVTQGDELATQLALSTIGAGKAQEVMASTGNRKKKGKKITLMSTNVRRGA
ncbi:MAG: hypothetical protein Q9222_001716 [Ikaeria aurantiellina]